MRVAVRMALLAALLAVVSVEAAPPRLDAPRKLSGGSFQITCLAAPALADFNGDGLPDLALTGSGRSGIYLNRGSRQRPVLDRLDVPLPIASHGSLHALDFNGDGLLDLVWRDYVLLNQGKADAPRFPPDLKEGPQVIRLSCGPLPEGYTPEASVALADLNGDGRLDLVREVFRTRPLYVAFSGKYVVAYDEGEGRSGRFGVPQWLSIRRTEQGREAEFSDHSPWLCFADMDGDGRLDPVLGTYAAAVFLPRRLEPLVWSLPAEPAVHRGGLSLCACPAVADLNGDGLPDLVIGDYDGAVHLALNRGDRTTPRFAAPVPLRGGDFRVASHSFFAVGDVDGDGLPDLVFTQRPPGGPGVAALLFRNVGTRAEPGFQFAGPLSVEGFHVARDLPISWSAPRLADVDSDGDADLLLAALEDGRDAARLLVLFGRGGSPARFFSHAPLAARPYEMTDRRGAPIRIPTGYNADWADLDGDGLADLVVGGPTAVFHHNVGRAGHPVLAEGAPLPAGPGVAIRGRIAVGDLNGDGLTDVVAAPPGVAPVFHENRGIPGRPDFATGAPVTANGVPLPFTEVCPAVADLDGDGAPDLLLAVLPTMDLYWLRAPRGR